MNGGIEIRDEKTKMNAGVRAGICEKMMDLTKEGFGCEKYNNYLYKMSPFS